ncbi:MAG: T9SS type A sorting domain-containing protein [Bacteroidia bacterium]
MKISKTLFVLSVSLLFSTVSLAQKPNHEWASSIGGTDFEQGTSVITDKSGNVYSTGLFFGKADFDPNSTSTSYLTSKGGSDIYILKLDKDGKFVWARNIGDTMDDAGNSINLDASGNVYVTGYFMDKPDFDPGSSSSVMTSAGGMDIFVCKFDASGNFVWASQQGGSDNEAGTGIDLDASDNVYITGYFNDKVDFDPDGKATAFLTSYGAGDIFVSRLDNKGAYVWAIQMGGSDNDEGTAIALDSIGYVYTTGYFLDQADFDPGSGSANLTAVGDADIFVSRLDIKGNYSWARPAGDNAFDAGTGIAVDGYGNSYTTGLYYGGPDFDPGTGKGQVYTLTSNGDYDIFVWKLNAAGSFVWAKTMGGDYFDAGLSIALDDNKSVFTTGIFEDVVDFDPGSGSQTLTSAGSSDIFISKLDISGNYVWISGIGGTDYDEGRSITVDKLKSVYTTGDYTDKVDFDPGSGTNYLTSAGDADAFVLKLSLCKASVTDLNISACNSYFFNGTTYYSGGNYTKILKNSTGCDSIVNLKLKINSATFETLPVGACNSYTINGQTYTSEGTYTQTLTNKAGCDSFLVIELKFLTSAGSIAPKACNTATINGQTYTKSGKYTQTLTNKAGCDSTLTINLSVFKSTSSNPVKTACNEYTMNGKTYTTSGTYTQKILNNASCDSNITLNLTVNYSSAFTFNKDACSSYTLNALTYNKSGDYTQTIANKKGCDSVITVKLSINNSAFSFKTTECQSYKLNNQTYNESGVYNQTIPNKKGCDSSITLNLTIKKVITTVTQTGNSLTSNATVGATYQWLDCNKGNGPILGEIGQSYTPTVTGDYAVRVTQNNCTDNSICYPIKVGKVANSLNNTIHVFPNPTKEEANIVLRNSLSNGTIKLITITGQTLTVKTNQTGDNFTINLSDQAKGIYFIEISQDGKVARVKLIKN